MSHLVDIMSKRYNVRHFSDQVPDKKIIDDILKKAHALTPHKNNLYYYRINVWGPEHSEEKRQVAISSVCSMDYRQYKNNPEKMLELEDIYDEWISPENKQKGYPKIKDITFNSQTLAPYLLVYTHNPYFRTSSQEQSKFAKSGEMDRIFYNKKTNSPEDIEWVIQASMHGITTAYLCAEYNLNASFCRCFFNSKYLPNNILLKQNSPKRNITFLLGIGYVNEDQKLSYNNKFKPLYEEIVEWK